MQSPISPSDTKPRTDDSVEALPVQQQTVERPRLRKITFGDLADPCVQTTVVALIKAALPDPNEVPDHDFVARLSGGQMEAFWVLTEAGQHAGVIAFECGYMPEMEDRGLYVVSATVAPHVTLDGWRHLVDLGRVLARERDCKFIQFDTTPANKRVIELGGILNAEKSHAHARCCGACHRFTVEV